MPPTPAQVWAEKDPVQLNLWLAEHVFRNTNLILTKPDGMDDGDWGRVKRSQADHYDWIRSPRGRAALLEKIRSSNRINKIVSRLTLHYPATSPWDLVVNYDIPEAIAQAAIIEALSAPGGPR